MGWCQARTTWRAPVPGASSRSRRRAVGHRTPEGQRSLSFLRPPPGRSRRAPVVAMRPPRPGGSAVLQLGWGTPCSAGRVGRVVGARVQDRCHGAPLAGGGVLGGLSPPPLRRPLVGRGLPWPRDHGVLSPRQRVGRKPWEAGGGRAGCSVCCPAESRVKCCLSLALGWRGNGGDVCPFGAGPLGPASGISGR